MTTTADKKVFLQLVNALNATKQYPRRHDFAFRHSAGRTESTKDLKNAECFAIISELVKDYGYEDTEAQCNEVRRKIIAMMHDMKWEVPGGKADMKRLDTWCTNQGPYKKALANHNLKELGILAGVFQKIYKQYMNKL